MTSLNLNFLMKEMREFTGRIPRFIKDLEYMIISDELTAAEFDLINEMSDKLYKIDSILKGNEDAKCT